MTTRTQQRHATRWVLPFLAAMVAALAAILLGITSPASAVAGAENRVRASAEPAAVLVGPPEHISAGQRLGNSVAGPNFVVATGVAAKGGSRLAEASAAAFRAADNPSSIFIKNKHLASSGIRGGKFASDDIAEVQGWVAQGLRSDGVQFLPNQLDDTFRAIVPAGRVVGTAGQTNIRVIVTNDGRVINAFPVNVR